MSQLLRERIAPVLSEAVVRSLRDQPSDPAGYLAEFVATRSPGNAASLLQQRRLSQEGARLQCELSAITQQLQSTRSVVHQRASVTPAPGTASTSDGIVAAAGWSEIRRLKRLIRTMKVYTAPVAPRRQGLLFYCAFIVASLHLVA